MRITTTLTVLAIIWILVAAAVIGVSPDVPAAQPASRPADAQFAPYAPNSDHLWNRLHQALFVREAPGVGRRSHTTDPLLFRDSKFLLEGEPHRRALALLDEFLEKHGDAMINEPLKRLLLQHDLWAAFDYVAWYPDKWVFDSRYEPAAIELRNRLAKAIGRLALGERELAALPDNYELAVKSKQYPAAHDPAHPERAFLPADLFDPKGSWVRFHEDGLGPMAERHFEGVSGRAVHVIFLRLPGARAATERYLKELNGEALNLKELNGEALKQFPPGTMVAMVRRALAVDRAGKIRVTPVTELVQIRVYRRIPADSIAHFYNDYSEQDVYEFVLDRTKLFAGQHGLRAIRPDDLVDPFEQGEDAFERGARADRTVDLKDAQLHTCIRCHQQPGVQSVLSMKRGLRTHRSDAYPIFKTFDWDVEMSYTLRGKTKQFNWGLLQGKLEAK